MKSSFLPGKKGWWSRYGLRWIVPTGANIDRSENTFRSYPRALSTFWRTAAMTPTNTPTRLRSTPLGSGRGVAFCARRSIAVENIDVPGNHVAIVIELDETSSIAADSVRTTSELKKHADSIHGDR